MQWPLRHGWRGWLWPALLATAITAASGQSQVAAPDLINADKLVHFLVFGLLATLVVRNGFAPRHAWVAVAAVSAFGAADEWHQSFTPGRAAEVADWVADTLGAAVAVALYVRSPVWQAWLERGGRRAGVAGAPARREESER